MKKVIALFRKELMLSVSLLAAAAALIITPPTKELLGNIDWKTLATLFMMLTVLEGFKKENIFQPVIRLSGRIGSMTGLSLFLVFGVFFSSMFVTNDVSLIIFVPLTILLFRYGDRERFILPVISMENIAAVRGSMLMPFGSPQNLFLFQKHEMTAGHFILHMMPLWVFSGLLLVGYVFLLYRKEPRMRIAISDEAAGEPWKKEGKPRRILYLVLFAVLLLTIITRTEFWPWVTLLVTLAVLIFDRKVLLRTDYVLLLTFFCFFVFSASITANEAISAFLTRVVAGREYFAGILLSQVISNVPASIVLDPFSTNLAGLIYGVDSAGLCTLIGSLASVINYRIYVREYPGRGGKFIRVFTGVSLLFFAVVVIPGLLLSRWPM